MQANATESPESAGYPPLVEIRQSLRIKWYRCPIETAVLRRLLQRSDWQGLLQAGGHFALWLCTAILAYACFAYGYWALLLAALFLHGSVASFFKGTAVHELGHGTVFKTAWPNKFFLYLFSTISWWDPFDYATSHTFHHRYTLHPQGDRENLLPLSPMTGRTFLLQLLTFNLYSPVRRTYGKGGFINTVVYTARGAVGQVGDMTIPSNEWLNALHTDQPAEHRKVVLWSRWLLAFHFSVLLLSVTSGQWVWFLIISCGSYFANIWSYLVGMTQHCGLKENDTDFRKSVRSITINPLWEFLYWRMNWHTEHHMFAGVPCYNLKALHCAVSDDMPAPRTLRQAWQEMIQTWRHQQTDPDYFYDTPVPHRTGAGEQQAGSELHESIGELAPVGLSSGAQQSGGQGG